MSAAEIAMVVEGWATLAGLMVVIAGAAFAGVQLRQEARSRHLQAMMAVFAEIRPPAVARAQQDLMRFPDGFSGEELTPDQLSVLVQVTTSFGRLGNLLETGMLQEADVFRNSAFSRGSIDVWEKIKHIARGERPTIRYNAVAIEYVAARAQDYLLREEFKRYSNIPVFDADHDALEALESRIRQVRGVAG